MSNNSELTEYILDLLHPVGDIETTKMFGGVLFKVGDVQLGVLLLDTFYLKVIDTEMQKEFIDKGSKQFSYTRKDKKDPVIIKNWWSVPDDAMDNSEELVRLAEDVLGQ